MPSFPTDAWRTFDFAGGGVHLAADGAVAAVSHPRPGRSMLLEERGDGIEVAMHGPDYRWGKGFVITDRGSRRFDTPTELSWNAHGVDLRHHLGGLTLDVSRRIGDAWTEEYVLRNVGPDPVSIGSFGVSTPWRDVYGSAADSLRRAVHAHVWTGGADAYVWAVPMDGSTPGIGLVVTEGELWAYSVESRDQFTGSNLRGHLYLHVTDRARAPHAMGGQPLVALEPTQTYRLGWRLAWFATLSDLQAARTPMAVADRLSVEIGRSVSIRAAPEVELSETQPMTSTTAELRHVYAEANGRRSRITVGFHDHLRDLVERRIRFALDHQRRLDLADSRRFAFVPYDRRWGLTVLAGGWEDWDDGRERIGTAVLLQEARARGWGDADELDQALAGYHRFVLDHLLHGERLYDFPWVARFLLGAGDPDQAAAVMDRFYELGGENHLAFELGSVLGDLAAHFEADGQPDDALRLRGYLLDQARRFVAYGADLPTHEVNYEQSVVAPLLDLLLHAHRLDPHAVPAAELKRRLPWLTSFAGDQPDVRLWHVPIRHWDDYWFGALRTWGDVFPHYWSVLSADLFLSWPAEHTDEATLARLHAAGRAILRSNLFSFHPDGSASCAFVYPSCVNGQPAHVADPLANDQDWGLVYALRHRLDDSTATATQTASRSAAASTRAS